MLSEKPWRPELVLRLMLGIFASMCLGVLVVSGYESLRSGGAIGGPNKDVVVLLVGTFTFQGVGLVLIDVFVRQHRISWSEAFGFNSPGLSRALFFAIVVGMLVFPIARSLAGISATFMTKVHMPVQQQQAITSLQHATAEWQRVYHGIIAIILAPLVEELLFRGILYPTIKQAGYKRFALWGSSMLFALMHNNLPTFLPLTFLAVILTLLYETTNNLLAPILTHCFFNAINYVDLRWHLFGLFFFGH